jgi:hypothetical protein
METQNITLALPKRILRRAKTLAAQKRISMSQLMVEALEGLIAQETDYAQARAEHLALLSKGFDLGTRGRITTTREALHER